MPTLPTKVRVRYPQRWPGWGTQANRYGPSDRSAITGRRAGRKALARGGDGAPENAAVRGHRDREDRSSPVVAAGSARGDLRGGENARRYRGNLFAHGSAWRKRTRHARHSGTRRGGAGESSRSGLSRTSADDLVGAGRYGTRQGCDRGAVRWDQRSGGRGRSSGNGARDGESRGPRVGCRRGG